MVVRVLGFDQLFPPSNKRVVGYGPGSRNFFQFQVQISGGPGEDIHGRVIAETKEMISGDSGVDGAAVLEQRHARSWQM